MNDIGIDFAILAAINALFIRDRLTVTAVCARQSWRDPAGESSVRVHE